MPGQGIGETIAVFDGSGKVVSTSKQLFSVFREAKAAYRERKAEIAAGRRASAGFLPAHPTVKHLQRGVEVQTISDNASESTIRDPRRPKSKAPRPSRHHHRRHSSSGSITTHSTATATSTNHRRRLSHDIGSLSAPASPLSRAHTTQPGQELAMLPPRPVSTLSRSATTPIDMDLAYGEYYPSPFDLSPKPTPQTKEKELTILVSKARMLLDEVDCAQHSVTTIIAHLQKHPDAMAAVALTLAEISNLATKLAPGALTALRTSAPAVFALLASPQFMIAAGVGVGITIVALGGYKIIKKIKQQKEGEQEGVDEMMEIVPDVNRIELWRRGIADVEMVSAGTTVEGEFITPAAAAMSGTVVTPVPERVRDLKGGKARKSKSRFSVSGRGESETASSSKDTSSTISRRSSKSEKSEKSEKKKSKDKDGKKDGKKEGKEKKSSPLRLMFH